MPIRINQSTRGWVTHFNHAVAQHTLSHLRQFTWSRLVPMIRTRHHWTRTDIQRWLTHPTTRRCRPITADRIETFNAAAVPITRHRHRGNQIPNPRIQAA